MKYVLLFLNILQFFQRVIIIVLVNNHASDSEMSDKEDFDYVYERHFLW